ncbi:MAG: LysM peptidoglycan-binding domain-containing protein [Actinomycetia bacterium]|nr:LysM peptidoglycan-binding domain-containing protein [Actinomycetes bacterium]
MAHTVVSGDTLSAIAAANGTTVEALAEANGIDNPNRISVGQVIEIPGSETETGGTETQVETEAPEDPLAAKVAENWPSWVYLLDHPEIGPILREAVAEDTGMSPEMAMSKIKATKWYRETSGSARTWDALQEMDPASAQRQIDSKVFDMRVTARTLGVTMTDEELRRSATTSLRNGYDPSDELQMLGGYLTYSPGAGSKAATALRSINEASARYMVSAGRESDLSIARRMIMGEMNEADMDTWFQTQARSSYGNNKTITDALDAGGDIRGLWGSRQQQIAGLYDITPDEVKWDDWQQVINHTDGDGATVMMDLADTRRHVKDRDDWAGTRQGKQAAFNTAQQIARAMGRGGVTA